MLFFVSGRRRDSRAAAFRELELAATLSSPVFRAPPLPDFDPPFFPFFVCFFFFAIM
jgi:hypothetical protein